MVSTVNVNTPNKKPKKKTGLGYKLLYGANSFFDRILRAIYITLLFVLDFVMFIYSINGRLLEDGVLNEAVLWIVGGVFGVALVVMLLLSFSSLAQNIFCAIFTLVMTLIFFNQFALFDVNTFIETWLQEHASALTFIGIIPSSFLVGLLLGVIVIFAFSYTLPLLLVCLAVVASVTSGVAQTEFKQVLPKTEYVVTKDLGKVGTPKQENSLVYMMMPKFPSYHFLSTVKDVNFRELRDLMVGFYAVNDFEIYPNAFVQKNDTVSNIVDIYNQVDYTSTSSGIRGYAEILNDWNFVHGTLNNYGLEDNLLYQNLKKDGYTISTYPMPGFNFCYNKDAMNSDRCVEKAYKTVKLYDKKTTLERNIYALLSEWVLSIDNRELQSVAKMLVGSSSLRGFNVISQNRRVSIEGSAALLERVSEDYGKDNVGSVYMTYVDLPSDIYIYDQYCNIKPRKEWIALKDSSLSRGGIDAKRKAYADQAKCLIGMMQMFMEDFLRDDKHTKTDVVIQGVSTIKEFAGMTAGAYNNFVADKLVSMGVRKASSPEFLVNTNVCLASDITKSMISGKEYCYTVENMRMSTDEIYNLQQNLINNAVIRGSKITNIAENYRDWYEEFKNNSPYYKAKREKAIEELVRQQMAQETEARRAYLRGERAEPVPTPVAVKPAPVVEIPHVQGEKTTDAADLSSVSKEIEAVSEKPTVQSVAEDVTESEKEIVAETEPQNIKEVQEEAVIEDKTVVVDNVPAEAEVVADREQVSVAETPSEEKSIEEGSAVQNDTETDAISDMEAEVVAEEPQETKVQDETAESAQEELVSERGMTETETATAVSVSDEETATSEVKTEELVHEEAVVLENEPEKTDTEENILPADVTSETKVASEVVTENVAEETKVVSEEVLTENVE